MSLSQCVNNVVQACYSASLNAGWWKDAIAHDPETGEPYPRLEVVGWKLALIHSEVSEAAEGFRKNIPDDKLPHRLMAEVELADAVIRIADLAGACGMDLGAAIEEKLAYNATRADHKPENRAAEGGKKF